jgi:hypothetical protein
MNISRSNCQKCVASAWYRICDPPWKSYTSMMSHHSSAAFLIHTIIIVQLSAYRCFSDFRASCSAIFCADIFLSHISAASFPTRSAAGPSPTPSVASINKHRPGGKSRFRVCASFEMRSPEMDPSFFGRSSLITDDEVIQLAAGCL